VTRTIVRVPFHVPTVTGAERAALSKLLDNGSLLVSDGHYSRACAESLRAHLGVEHVLFTPSCTAALEMAALLTIQPGDEVIVPSFTFVSSVSSFSNIGAKPVFCDVRPDTLNIDEAQIAKLVTPRTKAIVAVHYGGVACEMDAINEIASRHGIAVVEDAAQALSGAYKGRPLGSIGDLACFSFHSTKNYHCGEGGALIVNRADLLARAEIVREKGTNRRAFFNGQTDKYTWVDRGSSYVPSELTMAFLSGQLQHIERIRAERDALYRRYVARLQPLADRGAISLPGVPDHCSSSRHLFYVLARDAAERERLLKHLVGRGIGATFHYVPLHTSPQGRLLHDGRPLPVTESVHERLVRVPLFPGLSDDALDGVCDEIFCYFGVKP
jgi:dTDP-4-amino-4,6-dideoxygalactose transaminase